MSILRGHYRDGQYRPGYLFAWLRPSISGNTINGLGEQTRRRATPVFWLNNTIHPWFWVQLSFYLRESWSVFILSRIVRSEWNDRFAYRKVAATKKQHTPEQFTESVKSFVLAQPECTQVGITKVTRDLIHEGGEERSGYTLPNAIILGGPMEYAEMASCLAHDQKPIRFAFWKSSFLPSLREVIDGYVRTQDAAIRLSDWIRAQGYNTIHHGGPKGADLIILKAAHSAGLGQLGKHGSLLNDRHGSMMRFAFVLTDMPLIADKPRDIGAEEFCRSCQLCVSKCPPGAIFNEKQLVRGEKRWYVDFDKCLGYFTESYACGICITVCPWSRPGVAPNISRKLLKKKERK